MTRNAGWFANGVVVSAALFGPVAGSAWADTMYGITFNNQLITIDTTTGAGTLVGSLDSNMAAYGLAVSNGKLYTYDQVAERIQQIDPATGHTLATINIGTPTFVGEGDLAFRSDGIGFLETAGGLGTGLVTFNLGVPSASFVGGTPTLFDGLAFDSSDVLYGMSQGVTDGGSKLYTLNQSTAALSLVGALNTASAPGEVLGGLTFGSDGTLWGELSNGGTASELVTIDKTTGQATAVGDITGFGNVSGIAFLGPATSTVPETSSVLLLGTCIMGAIGLRFGRRVFSVPARHPRA